MADRGIDVSHWQGRIDWGKVAGDGVRFAMCKATQGTPATVKKKADANDEQWPRNRAGARAAGIPVGAYHFATPGAATAAAEVAHHLAHARPEPGDLVNALDLERTSLSPRETTRWALAWLTAVEEEIGARPIIYTGPDFIATKLHPDPALGTYKLWLARYTKVLPPAPAPWKEWMWWQHTDKGTTAGITGPVDTNRFASEALPLYKGARPDGLTMDAETKAAFAALEQRLDARDAAIEELRRLAGSGIGWAKAYAVGQGITAAQARTFDPTNR